MPEIKIYTTKETIPATAPSARLSTGAFTAVPEALEGLGKTGQDIAVASAKRQEKIKTEQDYIDALNANTELRTWTNEQERTAATTTGQNARKETLLDPYMREFDKKVATMQGKLSVEAGKRFRRLATSVKNGYSTTLSNHIARQHQATKKATEASKFQSINESIQNNPLSYDDNVEAFNVVIDSLHTNQEKAFRDLLKKEYATKFRTAQLEALLNKDNLPALELSEEYFNEIKGNIENRVLVDKYEDEFKSRKKVMISEAKTQTEEAESKIKKDAGEQVSGFINNGSYVEALDYIRNNTLISEDTERILTKRVKTASKSAKESEPDSNIEAKILLHIEDPTYSRTKIRQEISDALIKGQIKPTRAENYFNNLNDPIFEDPYFKNANSFFRENFGWSKTGEQFLFPGGAVSYRVSVNALQDRIKKEGLVGNDIRKAAVEIAIPALREFWVNTKFMSPAEASNNIRRLAESVGIKVPKFEANPDPNIDELGITTDGETKPPLSSYNN